MPEFILHLKVLILPTGRLQLAINQFLFSQDQRSKHVYYSASVIALSVISRNRFKSYLSHLVYFFLDGLSYVMLTITAAIKRGYDGTYLKQRKMYTAVLKIYLSVKKVGIVK